MRFLTETCQQQLRVMIANHKAIFANVALYFVANICREEVRPVKGLEGSSHNSKEEGN